MPAALSFIQLGYQAPRLVFSKRRRQLPSSLIAACRAVFLRAMPRNQHHSLRSNAGWPANLSAIGPRGCTPCDGRWSLSGKANNRATVANRWLLTLNVISPASIYALRKVLSRTAVTEFRRGDDRLEVQSSEDRLTKGRAVAYRPLRELLTL